VDKANEIGENTFLKIKLKNEKLKEERDMAVAQRDIALRRQKKLEDVVKQLRGFIEVNAKKK
jgi:hypothetical protein